MEKEEFISELLGLGGSLELSASDKEIELCLKQANELYDKQFNEQRVNGVDKSESTCNLQNVSNRRELLFDFLQWYNEKSDSSYEDLLDEYFTEKSNNSC
jgi:hypothetical protein